MTIPEAAKIIANLKESRQDWFFKKVIVSLTRKNLNENEWVTLLYMVDKETLLEMIDFVNEIHNQDLEQFSIDLEIDRARGK